MTLRPYKFIVQAVVQQVDDEVVTGEATLDPVVVFGCDQLADFAAAFPAKLAELDGVTKK